MDMDHGASKGAIFVAQQLIAHVPFKEHEAKVQAPGGIRRRGITHQGCSKLLGGDTGFLWRTQRQPCNATVTHNMYNTNICICILRVYIYFNISYCVYMDLRIYLDD